MVQYKNNPRKNLARSLRGGGYSYAEIQKFVNASKATLSYWFRDLKLSDAQLERLQKKRAEAIKVGTKNRSENVLRAIEQIEMAAGKDIGKISKRELWLMGLMLYWRHQNKNDIRKGVSFTSSDPDLIRLFLKWLKEVGQIDKKEVAFDLFLGRPKDKKKALDFWSVETGFPLVSFANFYYYKKEVKSILKVRVKASSMLARQILGWTEGIKENIR
ncbi:MAG: hypothetical protein A3I39_01450 [Candidatus Yanofskybacteria bacterium RIFCSPLOWO2_02_FULL_47_9b]|uniref:Uncharacterized protein n=1 Tax=Candidatus Yanofskybacteria bacterium RIFCSPLOWO2_02_FULL_47_9b TaxID=1802708 RepID=A0A1F8HA94_9BACT|nr:MAG: hypothetical protein A3I39_01450 [Candidatus Yanofskybacteria bacterium RIFCSPLOWO2_02_FULL_47_9b]